MSEWILPSKAKVTCQCGWSREITPKEGKYIDICHECKQYKYNKQHFNRLPANPSEFRSLYELHNIAPPHHRDHCEICQKMKKLS